MGEKYEEFSKTNINQKVILGIDLRHVDLLRTVQILNTDVFDT